MEVVSNLHPSPFGPKVRTSDPRPSTFVRTISLFTISEANEDPGSTVLVSLHYQDCARSMEFRAFHLMNSNTASLSLEQ
jgi:hypothetical protein